MGYGSGQGPEPESTPDQTAQYHNPCEVSQVRNYKIEDFVALDTFYISYIVNVEIKLSEIRISVAYTDQRRGTKGLF